MVKKLYVYALVLVVSVLDKLNRKVHEDENRRQDMQSESVNRIFLASILKTRILFVTLLAIVQVNAHMLLQHCILSRIPFTTSTASIIDKPPKTSPTARCLRHLI